MQQTLQALGEMVAAKEFPSVKACRVIKIFKVCDLVDQIVSSDELAGRTGLSDCLSSHDGAPILSHR
jgi:hypothetical protein